MKLQNPGHNEVPVIENYPQAKEGAGCHGSRLLINRKFLGEIIKTSGLGAHEGQTTGEVGVRLLQKEAYLADPGSSFEEE